ncbi:MAG: hypothetical protein WCP09_00750 [Candidatus Taylorbacteria bacterium]
MQKQSTDTSFEEAIRKIFVGERECRHMPQEPVEMGEIELGVLQSTVAKALYSLSQEMSSGARNYIEGLPDKVTPEEKAELILQIEAKLHKIKNRTSCVSSLFWELVYSEFPKSRSKNVSIGIREGWKVVMFKNSNPMEDFLRNMMQD